MSHVFAVYRGLVPAYTCSRALLIHRIADRALTTGAAITADLSRHGTANRRRGMPKLDDLQ
ncbi:hypothetical protein GCM10018952_43160 [Streptosporangium vulgare]